MQMLASHLRDALDFCVPSAGRRFCSRPPDVYHETLMLSRARHLGDSSVVAQLRAESRYDHLHLRSNAASSSTTWQRFNSVSIVREQSSASSAPPAERRLADVIEAARRGDEIAVVKSAMHCSRRSINSRAAAHALGAHCLTASPAWYAAYRGDEETLQLLLGSGALASSISNECDGGACDLGGQSALHVAVAKRSTGCVRELLALGADPHLPMCFPVDRIDQPAWNADSCAWTVGVAGMDALHVAAHRRHDGCVALLEAAPQTSASASAAAMGAVMGGPHVPMQPLESEDGSRAECPICIMPLSEHEVLRDVEWVACCGRAFHSACLSRLEATSYAAVSRKCPTCRAER